MASNTPKVVIDSCTLISRSTGKPPEFQQGIQNLFDDVDRGRVELWGSTILYVEVLGEPYKNLPNPAKDGELLDFLSNAQTIRMLQVNRQVALIARELRIQYKKHSLDCIHLATAVYLRADYFMSTDSDFLPFGAGVEGVKIQLPDSPLGTSTLLTVHDSG